MWRKPLITVILFYLFALLQNSFFLHFNLFGAVPNLVFALFFVMIFFSARGRQSLGWEDSFYAITAGIFLDFYSYSYLGTSIILLIALGFLLRKIKLSLQNKGDGYPYFYFLPLFLASLFAYDSLSSIYLYFIGINKEVIVFTMGTVFALIYNSIIASTFFCIYKRFFCNTADNRQMKLFR